MTQEDPFSLKFQINILGLTAEDSKNLGKPQYCFLDIN